jgi:hypothetical protein
MKRCDILIFVYVYLNFTIMKHKTRKGCKSTRKRKDMKTRRIRIQHGGIRINHRITGEFIGDYEGPEHNGQPQGPGKMTYEDGTVYEGDFEDGLANGRGKCEYSDGNVYEGEFENDVMHGRGKMTYLNGDVYEGNWLNNAMTNGVLTYGNGHVYEGEFENNQRHGIGKMTYDDGDVYVGNWLNNAMTNGVMTYPDGAVYEGEFENAQRHGRGKLTYADGIVYEGKFKNNQRHGRGRLTYADEEIYKGKFKNDAKNGQGTMTYEDGAVYEGGWSANYKNGHGKMTYANGDVYVGPWSYDNWHGADGKMTYADGRVYEGEWWNGNMHGDGTMTSGDGSIMYEGLWRDNQRNPLFNPDTGALADNAEYNARRPPKIFPISDNMLYQSDTYEYYDLGEMEDRHVLEALEEDHDAIAFKVNRTYYVVSMYGIVRVANNKNFIQYECPILVDLAVNQRDLERVIKTEPYLSINGMGIQLVGVVSLFDIWSAIKSGHRAFELVGTRRVLLSTASHNIMFAYGSLVSSNHCQSGIPATVYELQRLRIAVAPPRIKPTRHAKLFRIKKNGTKKLNRVINFMRGVRKQSHVRTQSRGQ